MVLHRPVELAEAIIHRPVRENRRSQNGTSGESAGICPVGALIKGWVITKHRRRAALPGLFLCYSCRKASTGCTLVANRAGRAQAKKAARAKTLVIATSIDGLATPMPSSLPTSARLDTTLNIAPSPNPTTNTRPVDPR